MPSTVITVARLPLIVVLEDASLALLNCLGILPFAAAAWHSIAPPNVASW